MIIRTIAALLLAVSYLALPTVHAAPQDGQKFKDWTARCETRKDGPGDVCYIFQNLLLKSQKKPLLHVAIGYLDGGEQPVAFFTLPLGVSLPGGLSLTVDDGKPLRMRYERCETSGCIAPLALTDTLVNAFKGGRWARVAFFDVRRREVSVPVSLIGFTAGFDSLEH